MYLIFRKKREERDLKYKVWPFWWHKMNEQTIVGERKNKHLQPSPFLSQSTWSFFYFISKTQLIKSNHASVLEVHYKKQTTCTNNKLTYIEKLSKQRLISTESVVMNFKHWYSNAFCFCSRRKLHSANHQQQNGYKSKLWRQTNFNRKICEDPLQFI